MQPIQRIPVIIRPVILLTPLILMHWMTAEEPRHVRALPTSVIRIRRNHHDSLRVRARRNL